MLSGCIKFITSVNPLLAALALCLLVALLVLGKKYFSGGVNQSSANLSGKVVIVTGGNAGIGKETVRELARLGASIVIAARDEAKARETIQEIENETGNKKLDFFALDLSDLDSVRRFCDKFLKTFNSLHILINNAGVMAIPERRESKQGFEAQMATNHYGHFLLTNLLLPVLKSSAPSRIINLSSRAHKRAVWNFNDLDCKTSYSPWAAYSNSKLANIYFTKELSKRLKGTQVKAVCLHPGVVRTELSSQFLSKNMLMKIILYMVYPLIWFISKTVKQGAQTSLHCALVDFEQLESGKYYADCRVFPSAPLSFNEENATKLWELSEKNVKLVRSGEESKKNK